MEKKIKYYPYKQSKQLPHQQLKKTTATLQSKQRNTKLSSTQTQFNNRKNSLKNINSSNGLLNNDIYQLLKSELMGQWETTKHIHEIKRGAHRPETSKGVRSYVGSRHGSREGYLDNNEQLNIGELKNSSQQCGIKLVDQKWLKRENITESSPLLERGFNQMGGERKIRIIVTRNKSKQKKQKSFYYQKFKSNLQDQFLSLFAQ